MNTSTRRIVALFISMTTFLFVPALGQVSRIALVALTLNTGAVIIAEVRYDTEKELKVYNLMSGTEETIPKAKGFVARTPTEERLLSQRSTVPGKRPDRLEAVKMVTYPTDAPEIFKRLGKYPENLGAYIAWAARRSAKGNEPVTIAVLPFRDNTQQITAETNQRAEELTNALVRWKMDVVERARLDQVINELAMQQGALFDESKAQQVGKQLGASVVVVGSLSPLKKEANLQLRLVDVATGKVLEAPTLNGIPGLPGQRVALRERGAAAGSIVGDWDMSNRTTWSFRRGGVLVHPRGQGRWTQSGLEVTATMSAGPAAQKKGATTITWTGTLDRSGDQLKVTNTFGAELSGTRH